MPTSKADILLAWQGLPALSADTVRAEGSVWNLVDGLSCDALIRLERVISMDDWRAMDRLTGTLRMLAQSTRLSPKRLSQELDPVEELAGYKAMLTNSPRLLLAMKELPLRRTVLLLPKAQADRLITHAARDRRLAEAVHAADLCLAPPNHPAGTRLGLTGPLLDEAALKDTLQAFLQEPQRAEPKPQRELPPTPRSRAA